MPLQGKTLRKKIRSGAQRKRKIFFSKPAGPGLDGKGIVQKFANQKGWENFDLSFQEFRRPFRSFDFYVAGSTAKNEPFFTVAGSG
jgi:hypothetical protein